ncbi:alpha-ketoglutarate-dependent dioxygenase AlkB [Rhizobium sp. TRM96647]|uniref:alpha-ketoglutarate-dependent dioxygenase AlkB family protein n=1 Tax=unclassified Rhizobium TaxID=2613769 RepID=UPI0021E88AC8|nr:MULTISPECIES: alpha-ketoglutarate-dependent dioxygenase AlkB [unclassified Rhizobium]MCV3735126.1 alpha-ketoglutarate-dependent dioxygenase AlkB [Rhizobium sp. TRM96647]MCV3757496.1 alpha-ketoglutarate-dependent dioxygenase AlkB [Rhizobium sp. TRM96650]
MTGHEFLPGFRYLPGHFSRFEQEALVAEIRAVAAAAPLYVPVMPKTGQPMSVRMTNCGSLGWVTDRDGGYRYQDRHPVSGEHWPPIPAALLRLWEEVSLYPKPPQACLVNFYDGAARMGLHQDRDERDLEAPVVSVSLGDQCLFRIGGTSRRDPTRSLRLSSGDVVVLGGESRLSFHGVDRVYPGTSTLLKDGGRLNLTLRRVDP